MRDDGVATRLQDVKTKSFRSERFGVRPWIVWATGLLAYIVAVLDRTTLGVSGLDAADRFGASPSVLSTFVVLQVIVYAGAQVPAGLLLDRFGSKALIVVGAALMASGQLVLAFTESLPAAIAARAVLGLGDAVTFISVLRLVPHWFSSRQVPLVTQLTGICGQLGQVLSAVPFFALLTDAGWTVAYVSVAAIGVLSMVLTLALVKNTPNGPRGADADHVDPGDAGQRQDSVAAPGDAAGLLHPHGHPVLRHGVRVDVGRSVSDSGPGPFAGRGGWPADDLGRRRHLVGHRRRHLHRAATASPVTHGAGHHRRQCRGLDGGAGAARSGAAVAAVVLIVVISVGGPGSMVGFDFARTFNPSATLGTAQGMVNMGGFVASLLVMQAMGLILDAAGDFSFESFRLAWTVQYAIWILAVVGILITRRKARRLMRLEQRTDAAGGLRRRADDAIALAAARRRRAGWPS